MHWRKLCLTPLIVLALAATAMAGPPKYSWKTATLAPDGIGWAKHMKEIIFPEMEKSTMGELKVKVYWGGIMGDEEDYLAKMRIGQLQGAGLSAQGAAMACPEIAVMELPFLFRNYYEVDYLRLKMDRTFMDMMEEKGLFLIGWIDQDFDQVYSAEKPMATLKDFKGTKFLTWYGAMEEKMLSHLGSDVIPVNVPELAAAVRQGVADAAIGPSVWVVGAQLYSRIKYVNPVKIRYSPAIIILTQDAWGQLPRGYSQEFYQKRLELGWQYCNKVRQDNEKFLNAMVSYGMTKIEMDPAQLQALEAKTQEVWDQVRGSEFSEEIYQETMGHLADYRAGKRLDLEDLKGMARMDDAVTLTPEFIKHMKGSIKANLEEFGVEDGALVDMDCLK